MVINEGWYPQDTPHGTIHVAELTGAIGAFYPFAGKDEASQLVARKMWLLRVAINRQL